MTSTTRAVLAMLVLGVGTAGACAGKDDDVRPSTDLVTTGGAGGASGIGGRAGASGGPAPGRECPHERGPEMVRIALPDVAAYCIDTTEVTQAQYAEFLAAKVNPQEQGRPYCREMNPAFEPVIAGDHVEGCTPGFFDPELRGEFPMGCVQFCDAIAFCEWAGKRLCGGVGRGGSPASEGDFASPKSQWYLACSQGGKTKYPYGDAFEPGRCDNGGKSAVAKPASESTCTGQGEPFDRIKNLTGNVREWEDAEYRPRDFLVRGNDAGATDSLGCDEPGIAVGITTNVTVGFRCCADLASE